MAGEMPGSDEAGRPVGRLPMPPVDLIGREAQVADVIAQLTPRRVLTLVGPGGSGKTSVALAVAHSVRQQFAHGVSWIDLGGITDPALVAGCFAAAVGAKLGPAGPLHSVRLHLVDKHVLLVVDNCEQVAAEVAAVVQALVMDCPRVGVLATSRQLLNLSFEVARTVEPLAVSGTPENPDRDCPAVRLFVERAAAGPSGFRLDASNIRPVWEVCRRLDGVPLAIELAAARCRTMSPAEIAEQLEAGYGSLVTDRRDAPPRQRSLEASLAWSWGLLDEPEQRVIARLAVLPADFGLEAAAAAADEPESVVLRRLTVLHDHSLLTVIQGTGPTRYRMLDTVRDYATQRFEARREWTATRDRLLGWSVLRAESITAGSPEEGISILESELPTFRAALDHAARTNATELGLRLATALSPVWWARHPQEGLVRFRSLLASGSGVPARTPGLMAGMLLAGFGFDFESGRSWAVEALSRAADDDRVLAAAHRMLQRAARTAGDVEAAYEHLAVAVEGYARLGDAAGIVDCKFAACEMALLSGDYQRALRAGGEAVSIARESGERGLIERALVVSGAAAHRRGDLGQAESLLTEALEIAIQIGEETYAGLVRGWLARVAAHRGRYDDAITLGDATLDGARRTGSQQHRLAGTWGRLLAAYESADPTLSVDEMEQGTAELARMMYPAMAADLAVAAAHLACVRGDLSRAQSLANQAARLAEAPLGGSATGVARLAQATVDAAAGNPDSAIGLIYQAVEEMERVSDRFGVITALEDLAGLLVAGSPQKARRLLEAAAHERGRVGCPVPRVRAAAVDRTRAAIESRTDMQPALPMSLGSAIALARRSRGPRVSKTVGWGSLTPTELRVIDCLADGCTNREVADRLLMSGETVKTHVAHILSKLEVKNRAAVAAVSAARDANQAPGRREARRFME